MQKQKQPFFKRRTMVGLTYAEITLVNGIDYGLSQNGRLPKEEVKQVTVKALVDSGAYMLVINENIKRQLDLAVYDRRTAILADGTTAECDIVGPVDVFFKTRSTTCRAIVLPGSNVEVLLGAIPIEDMDVLIDLKNNELILPPDRPYISQTIIK
jgi:clan AA aspartic protease